MKLFSSDASSVGHVGDAASVGMERTPDNDVSTFLCRIGRDNAVSHVSQSDGR